MKEQKEWNKSWMVLCLCVLMFCTSGAWADFTFGEPVNLGAPINTPLYESAAYGFSDDGLSLAFVRQPSGADYVEAWLATRPTIDSPWETLENLGIANDLDTAFIDPNVQPCFTELMSPDGLEAYFTSMRAVGYGSSDIWMMRRATLESQWEQPINLGSTVNSHRREWQIALSPDGLELYFCDDNRDPRPGGYGSVDIWVTRREAIGAPWNDPVNLGPNVNSAGWDSGPYLSRDGLLLLFDSNRSTGYGSWDLYMARRASLSDPWEPAVSLGPIINSSATDGFPQLSADGFTLYWGSRRPGGHGDRDIWEAPVIPIVDFNSDGFVDLADITIMIDRWGTDDSVCDIGPMPWGDGVVDIEDLKVFIEYWEQENMPQELEE